MVEETKILEDDADAPAHLGDLAPGEARDVAAEQADQAARGLEGEIHDAKQGGFAGPARPDEEMERARRQSEAGLMQDLGPVAVAQQHLVEDDQAATSLPRWMRSARMAQPDFSGKARPGRPGGQRSSGLMGLLAKPSLARTFEAFDRSGRLARPPYRRLAAEAWAQFTYRPTPPDPEALPDEAALPDGKGHVVLVIPAFATTDSFTQPLRAFLARLG